MTEFIKDLPYHIIGLILASVPAAVIVGVLAEDAANNPPYEI